MHYNKTFFTFEHMWFKVYHGKLLCGYDPKYFSDSIMPFYDVKSIAVNLADLLHCCDLVIKLF